MLNYNLYYESLFCTKKFYFIQANEDLNYLYKPRELERQLIIELLNYFSSDDYELSNLFTKKQFLEYLDNLKIIPDLLVNKTYNLSDTFQITSNNPFFSFTPFIHNFDEQSNQLVIHSFDCSTFKLPERKALISAMDYSALFYMLRDQIKHRFDSIKIYLVTVFKASQPREIILDLNNLSTIEVLEARKLKIVNELFKLSLKNKCIKATPSRFNCSRCAFAYRDLCVDGNAKYFNKRNYNEHKHD